MVSLCMAKLGVAKGANMWLVASPAGVLNLVATLALHFAGVPFRTWWSGLVSILPNIFLLLLLEIRFGDCLYRLHHTGRIHFRRDAGPGNSTIIKIIKYPPVIVPSSVPGKGGVVIVGGEHGSELH